MQITQGFGGGGSSSASTTVTGNGIVVHNDGLLSTVPLIGIAPLRITSPEGLDGPPTFTAQAANHPLGYLIGANGNSILDQAIPITGTTKYIIRRIVITNASAVPTLAAGGVYTLPGKAGTALAAASQVITSLTDASKMLDIAVTPALVSAPYLYLTLTTANGTALTFDMYAYGDVVNAIEG